MAVIKVKRPELNAGEKLYLGAIVKGFFITMKHAVASLRGKTRGAEGLASAVRSSLALADRHGLQSVAVPAISTGAFGFPVSRCARVTLTEIHRYMQGGTKLDRVVVCLFDKETFSKFRQELRRGFR